MSGGLESGSWGNLDRSKTGYLWQIRALGPQTTNTRKRVDQAISHFSSALRAQWICMLQNLLPLDLPRPRLPPNKETLQCLKDFHSQQSALLDAVLKENHLGAVQDRSCLQVLTCSFPVSEQLRGLSSVRRLKRVSSLSPVIVGAQRVDRTSAAISHGPPHGCHGQPLGGGGFRRQD